MRVIERLDPRDVGPVAQHRVHHRADIGIGVHREQHRDVVARRRCGAIARAIASMPPPKFSRRCVVTQDDPLAGEARRRSGRARRRAPGRRRSASRVQCSASITVLPVTWIVAGSIVLARSAPPPRSRSARNAGRRSARRCGGSPPRARAGRCRPSAVPPRHARPGPCGNRRRARPTIAVAVSPWTMHAVGLLGVHHLAQPGQQPRGQPVERLARLHQVEVDVGRQPGDRRAPGRAARDAAR